MGPGDQGGGVGPGQALPRASLRALSRAPDHLGAPLFLLPIPQARRLVNGTRAQPADLELVSLVEVG